MGSSDRSETMDSCDGPSYSLGSFPVSTCSSMSSTSSSAMSSASSDSFSSNRCRLRDLSSDAFVEDAIVEDDALEAAEDDALIADDAIEAAEDDALVDAIVEDDVFATAEDDALVDAILEDDGIEAGLAAPREPFSAMARADGMQTCTHVSHA